MSMSKVAYEGYWVAKAVCVSSIVARVGWVVKKEDGIGMATAELMERKRVREG